MKIYFDGGCRPNPGRIEVAVVAAGICYFEPDLGFGSNNDAEWLAAIYALNMAGTLGVTDIQLLGDSALVVGQANGTTRCRSPKLVRHGAAFDGLRSNFVRVRVRRITRTQNLAGIFLSKRHSGR
ncbi:reverse transcriptase-like protein [Glacieibacterium frigidum]|uniref:Reverse transcriptase-like protein n=1 Tax=Glacieibacterium frigidum TaxID=2593303 RepID=A0A552U8D5_9SPHN|nr:reverse transcriptase-like protein [Glacieibacterium frigidum]TRW14476.1 reverse transcriptase-like protein [Glacieibacterium frigidum]